MPLAERSHMFALDHALDSRHRQHRGADGPPVRAGLKVQLGAITGAAALLMTEYGDVAGANDLGQTERAGDSDVLRRP